MKKMEIFKAYETTNRDLLVKFNGNKKNTKIAKKCLELCQDWVLIKLDEVDGMEKRFAKKDCKKYVKDNLKKDVYGNILISILLGVLVRLIVDWVVNNFIYNLKKE